MEIWILSEVIDIETKYLSIYPICTSSFVIFPAHVFLPIFLLICLSFIKCEFYGLRILSMASLVAQWLRMCLQMQEIQV